MTPPTPAPERVTEAQITLIAKTMFDGMGGDYDWSEATDSDVNFWVPLARKVAAALAAALAAGNGGGEGKAP